MTNLLNLINIHLGIADNLIQYFPNRESFKIWKDDLNSFKDKYSLTDWLSSFQEIEKLRAKAFVKNV